MTGRGHGGAALTLARELGLPLERIIDASASINPLGAPESALEAARRALDTVGHYPEIDAASLLAALAEHHGLPVDLLAAGNGSTELIYLLPRLLGSRSALIVTPAFSEYEQALLQAGTRVVHMPLSPADAFCFSAETVLERLDDATRLVVVANPGNPSGVGIAPAALLQLADRLAGRAALVVDEAFVDFAPELSVIMEVEQRDNLYVLRSMTKFYAIPGLRIGYLAGPAGFVRLLRRALPPWSVNTPAQAAAIACLQDTDFRQRSHEQIPRLRAQLVDGLAALGATLFPSVANYLLLRLPETAPRGPELVARLRGNGILVRDCSNFHGLDDCYLRLAVRTEAENERVVAALRRELRRDG